MKRKIFFQLILLWPVTMLLAQQQEQSPWPVKLKQRIEQVTRSHPMIEAATADQRASESRRREVRAWEPPLIGIDWFQMPGRWLPNPMRNRETDIFVQQMIPWPGKNLAMERVVMEESKMKEALRMDRVNRMAREMKEIYIEQITIHRKLAVNQREQALQEQYLKFLESGTLVLSAQKALQARTELTMMRIEELELRQMQEKNRASMLVWVDSTEFSEIDSFCVTTELPGDPVTWFQLALRHHPQLAVWQQEALMYRREEESAQAALYPDVMLRVMYKMMPHNSGNAWSIMGGFTLPVAWWSKSGSEAQRTRNHWLKNKANAEREAMIREIRSQAVQTHYGIQRNLQIRQQYKELNRQLQKLSEILTARVLSDPMSTGEWIETEKQQLRLQNEIINLEAEWLRQIAELEWLTGLPVEQWAEEIRLLATHAPAEKKD